MQLVDVTPLSLTASKSQDHHRYHRKTLCRGDHHVPWSSFIIFLGELCALYTKNIKTKCQYEKKMSVMLFQVLHQSMMNIILSPSFWTSKIHKEPLQPSPQKQGAFCKKTYLRSSSSSLEAINTLGMAVILMPKSPRSLRSSERQPLLCSFRPRRTAEPAASLSAKLTELQRPGFESLTLRIVQWCVVLWRLYHLPPHCILMHLVWMI